MKLILGFAVALTLFISCSKDSDPAPDNDNPGGGSGADTLSENEQRAAAFETFIQANKFQLASYYSDSAIDYNDNDSVVKSETDLWAYVSSWLKDDVYSFAADGNVTIEQNASKYSADTSAVLTRPYDVSVDDDGVKVTFLTNQYESLDYRLESFSESVMTLSASWDGKTVKSDYKVVQ